MLFFPSDNNKVSISELRFLSLVARGRLTLSRRAWRSFNLRIEILIIGRNWVGLRANLLSNVSISELRFLSLVADNLFLKDIDEILVSISELRFLSLVADNLFLKDIDEILVSISELRFLSLVADNLFLKDIDEILVSISELRFLSLVDKARAQELNDDYMFQSQN